MNSRGAWQPFRSDISFHPLFRLSTMLARIVRQAGKGAGVQLAGDRNGLAPLRKQPVARGASRGMPRSQRQVFSPTGLTLALGIQQAMMPLTLPPVSTASLRLAWTKFKPSRAESFPASSGIIASQITPARLMPPSTAKMAAPLRRIVEIIPRKSVAQTAISALADTTPARLASVGASLPVSASVALCAPAFSGAHGRPLAASMAPSAKRRPPDAPGNIAHSPAPGQFRSMQHNLQIGALVNAGADRAQTASGAGSLFIDGTALGRWLIEQLGRELGRPRFGTVAVDPRAGTMLAGPLASI